MNEVAPSQYENRERLQAAYSPRCPDSPSIVLAWESPVPLDPSERLLCDPILEVPRQVGGK